MTRTARLAAAAAAAAALLAACPAGAQAATTFDIHASVRLSPSSGAVLVHTGTFTGAPLGSGSARVRTRVGKGRGAIVRFTLSGARGTVRGRANCSVTFRGSAILYDGTAKITGGTGAFRGMRARGLRVSGRSTISGETFAVALTGAG